MKTVRFVLALLALSLLAPLFAGRQGLIGDIASRLFGEKLVFAYLARLSCTLLAG